MSDLTKYGKGIQKTSTRPIRIHVDAAGDYWLCDSDVDANTDFAEAGCLSHSSVPMAEGG